MPRKTLIRPFTATLAVVLGTVVLTAAPRCARAGGLAGVFELSARAEATHTEVGRPGVAHADSDRQRFEPGELQTALASQRLPFNDQPELQRRLNEAMHRGVSLFPIRKGVMNGDLMFGVDRKGLVGVFLAPRGLN
jgi:hypothetical protein